MIQKQTVIGIVPSFDEGKLIPGGEIARLYLRRDYLQAIAGTGAVPIIIHPEMPLEAIVAMCDGIVISGGADIAPEMYGQQPDKSVSWLEPRERFEWERQLIDACDTQKVPILGICYGMQRLNVHYGGDLIQDIFSHVQDAGSHSDTYHSIRTDRIFLGLEPGVEYCVNSRHHQAVGVLAPGFEVAARTPDGVIEAIEGNGHYGVQWHPESDDTAIRIYSSFAARCQPRDASLADFLPEPLASI